MVFIPSQHPPTLPEGPSQGLAYQPVAFVPAHAVERAGHIGSCAVVFGGFQWQCNAF